MRFLLTTAAVLAIASFALAAEPPKVKGYVSAEEHEALKARVVELEKAIKPCTCSGECCKKVTSAAAIEAVKPAITAAEVYSYDGFPMRVSADGFHWERVPGATAQPSMVRVGNAIPASYTAPVCSGPGCSAPIPSYAPTYLPGYSLPSGSQSCPGGRCPTR